ncbi:hypothetical protein [Tenacibaculum sp. 190524A02b]|uniref:hypothetical protein n=1 Tax=Tenacibaculum vairaonense TaxID=3137860 RepID=UPI0031FB2370
MKNLIYPLFFLILFSCKKNCTPDYEIISSKYSNPFISGQNEMIRKFDKIDFDRYRLADINESEVPYIMKMIKSQIPLNKKATERMKNNICDYSVQIGGFYDVKDKTKKIYLNFLYGWNLKETKDEILIGNNGEETKFEIVNDGGDYFFQAIIDTKKDTLHIIYINGEA